MKLSVIIPCYNEKETISEVIKRVMALDMLNVEIEVIAIDDGSSDGTTEILKNLKNNFEFKFLLHEKNLGKGRAVKTGLSAVTGDYVIMQDADLEYNPRDYQKLLDYAVKNNIEAVYGSRRLGSGEKHNYSYFSFYLGGNFLNWLMNFLYGTNLTDMCTCYKLTKTEILKGLDLKCRRFGFDSEIVARTAQKGVKIREIPISYQARRKNEGKKIRWKDGIEIAWALIRCRIFSKDGETFLDKFFRWIRFKKVIKHIPDNSFVCDIGCGKRPYFLNKVSSKIKRGVGFDKKTEDYFNGKIETRKVELVKNIPFESNYFDAVTLIAVLEHLNFPEAIISESFRILKEKGKIIIAVPSLPAEPFLKIIAALRLADAKEVEDHKRSFNREEVNNMLIRAGFKRENIGNFSFNFFFNNLIIAEKNDSF